MTLTEREEEACRIRHFSPLLRILAELHSLIHKFRYQVAGRIEVPSVFSANGRHKQLKPRRARGMRKHFVICPLTNDPFKGENTRYGLSCEEHFKTEITLGAQIGC